MWATKLMDLAQWTESHPMKPSNGMSLLLYNLAREFQKKLKAYDVLYE